jgi:hypothetical protein
MMMPTMNDAVPGWDDFLAALAESITLADEEARPIVEANAQLADFALRSAQDRAARDHSAGNPPQQEAASDRGVTE